MGPTLLIGLDGATFTVLDPYMERGVMPFLAELSARGTRAVLRSIMPPLTPPAWTSLVTGQAPRPARHLRLLPEGGAGQRVLLLRQLAGGAIRDDLDARQRAGPAGHLAELPADVPAAAGGRGGRARRDDALAPAAPRLPPAGPVRPAQAAPGLQPARDARHGARDQGDRRLPGGRVRGLRRAPHPPRAALGRGSAPPDGDRARPTWWL